VVVLLARFLGVGIPVTAYRLRAKVPKYTIRILTWSGLRGGISVALALSLYQNAKDGSMLPETVNLITVMTYCVVLFSIVVQGLTVKKLFAKAESGLDLPKSENTEE
jgi:CPA1 family monovalent cation:H+ antiporter